MCEKEMGICEGKNILRQPDEGRPLCVIGKLANTVLHYARTLRLSRVFQHSE